MKQRVGEASPARRADQPLSAGNPSRAGKPPWPSGPAGGDGWEPGEGLAVLHGPPTPRRPAPASRATGNLGRSDIYRRKMTVTPRPGTAVQSVSNLAGWEFPFSGLPVEALFQISTAGEACDFT